MVDMVEYKCLACGGKLEFDSATQKMKCPFCDSMFDISELTDAHATQSDGTAEWAQNAALAHGDEMAGMNIYKCQSCGGEIIVDATTSASSCPYCDNPVVMMGAFTGGHKPDLVIPFKVDKKAAKNAFLNHFKGKRFLPKAFKSDNRIDEIKGVYVPIWLFDSEISASFTYTGEKERTWSDDDYEYTETSYYSVSRAGDIAFTNVPVDGSTKMDDQMFESIEPFDINQAVDFNPAYLSGYLADKYDVTSDESVGRADERMAASTEQRFRNTVKGYDRVDTNLRDINFNSHKTRYALYPVWLLNISWEGKKFHFGMNGQTGKFVGNLPIDKKIAFGYFGGIMAAVTAVSMLLMTIF